MAKEKIAVVAERLRTYNDIVKYLDSSVYTYSWVSCIDDICGRDFKSIIYGWDCKEIKNYGELIFQLERRLNK